MCSVEQFILDAQASHGLSPSYMLADMVEDRGGDSVGASAIRRNRFKFADASYIYSPPGLTRTTDERYLSPRGFVSLCYNAAQRVICARSSGTSWVDGVGPLPSRNSDTLYKEALCGGRGTGGSNISCSGWLEFSYGGEGDGNTCAEEYLFL